MSYYVVRQQAPKQRQVDLENGGYLEYLMMRIKWNIKESPSKETVKIIKSDMLGFYTPEDTDTILSDYYITQRDSGIQRLLISMPLLPGFGIYSSIKSINISTLQVNILKLLTEIYSFYKKDINENIDILVDSSTGRIASMNFASAIYFLTDEPYKKLLNGILMTNPKKITDFFGFRTSFNGLVKSYLKIHVNVENQINKEHIFIVSLKEDTEEKILSQPTGVSKESKEGKVFSRKGKKGRREDYRGR